EAGAATGAPVAGAPGRPSRARRRSPLPGQNRPITNAAARPMTTQRARKASEVVDHGRRRFIKAATSVVGGVGIVSAAVPFIKSWEPSARAKAAGAPV